ncbi:MAG: glycine cleavage system protein H [Beggiatoa sp. IS2]|nr:MAG: glycine cleavage system protein H [Beggiatoa sp. IS2]
MNQIPEELKYAKTHEWVRLEEDGTFTVGITDHAQQKLGDLVYVELPEIGQPLDAGEEAAVIESVKAAADVYSPISGEVTQVNEMLVDKPQILNQSPYEQGWLFKLTPFDTGELNNLLAAKEYAENLKDED